MKFSAIILLLCLAAASPSRCGAGILTMLDGQTVEGGLTIDRSGSAVVSVIVTPKNGPKFKLDLPSILSAKFEEPRAAGITAGIQFRCGSALSGSVLSLDSSAAVFESKWRSLTVPVTEISRVLCQPVPYEIANRTPAGQSGVLLANGDFFSGQVRGVTGQQVRVNSKLFGVRPFDMSREVSAIVLRDVRPVPSNLEVRTTDGSLFLCRSLRWDRDALVAEDAALGPVRVPPADLSEIRQGSARALPLTALQPARVDGPADANGATNLAVDAPLNNVPLTVDGRAFVHAIGMLRGTTANYVLPADFSTLVCSVGVPGITPSDERVTFAVFGDGRALFRSPPRGAADPPCVVRANLTRVRTLSLRAEPAGKSDTVAIWGDPLLLKR